MAVDYAKKKPPKRRATPKKRKTPAAKPKTGAVRNQRDRSVSLPRLVLTILAVIAFVVALFMLKSKGNPEQVKKSAAQQRSEEALPALPEERWSYIEALENKEVEVIVPERAASRPRLIQCASFRNEADADAMRAKIAFMGLEAQVRATQGETGMWYRVILGPFENQRAAQSTTHKLQRGGVNNCQIWNWTD